MILMQGWISWVALIVSALTFLYARHEARRRKRWLVNRLTQFRVDIQAYKTEIHERGSKAKAVFPFGVIAHVPLWTEMQLDTVDVSLLAELDDPAKIQKQEASLGFIKYQLERWYTQPLVINLQHFPCFQVDSPADMKATLQKLEDLLDMIDLVLNKLDRWYRKIW